MFCLWGDPGRRVPWEDSRPWLDLTADPSHCLQNGCPFTITLSGAGEDGPCEFGDDLHPQLHGDLAHFCVLSRGIQVRRTDPILSSVARFDPALSSHRTPNRKIAAASKRGFHHTHSNLKGGDEMTQAEFYLLEFTGAE